MKKTLLILACFLLCSCYDSSEPNDLAYATAIGIDQGQNNNFNITIQFAKPHNISGGENGGSGSDILGNITVEAPNIYAAIGLGNHILSKSLDMSHLRLFLFSQTVAEKGIHNFIETISRSKEIRPNVYTAVCKGEASDYLKKASPVVDINPAKYYQLIFGKNEFRSIPQSFSQDLYFNMHLPERNSVIPLTGVPEGTEEQSSGGQEDSSKQEGSSQSSSPNPLINEAPLNQDTYQFSLRDYEAGEIEVFSDSKGEVTGGAVFKGDKMVGTIGMIETQIYNYLTSNTGKNYISFKTEKSTSPVTVLLGIDDLTKISYNKDKHLSKISLSFSADFVSLPDDYLAEQDIDYFTDVSEKAIKHQVAEFIRKTQQEFDSDVVGFGFYAKSKFPSQASFEKFGWDEKYKYMKFDIDVDLNVRRTGFTLRTQ